jgi:hypothetical protein
MPRWRSAGAVFGAAILLAPPIAGLLVALWQVVHPATALRTAATIDALGLLGTHIIVSYLFGIIPAVLSGLALSLVTWRRGTFSSLVCVTVSALSTLAYCLAIALSLRNSRVLIMTTDRVIGLVCLAVATALIVRAVLRWARFI